MSFGKSRARTMALQGVFAEFQAGQFTIVGGPSGSGKTSLLSVIGGLLSPDEGAVVTSAGEISGMDKGALAAFRRQHCGFVFQGFRLFDALSAAENLAMSLALRQMHLPRRAIDAALDAVGLSGKARLRPNEMSGGEKQRVAVARALLHEPAYVFADEPTASLDRESGLRVAELLRDLVVRKGRLLVLVSHDERLTPFADRVLSMEDGRIVS
nr:ABC transporter ATP-binding protein [Acuticoccus mangrovi]